MKAVDVRNKILNIDGGRPTAKRGYAWKTAHLTYREIAKIIIDRPLRRNEHVHHIDEDHSNNDPDNLLVVTVGDHNRIHHGLAPKDFHWPGELVIPIKSDCEHIIQRPEPEEYKPKPVRAYRYKGSDSGSRLTRSDLRIMKLI